MKLAPILVIWLLAGAIYFKTLPPSILYIDAGTMIAAAAGLGIPNPPGFPSYILIGHLFTLLPFGSVLFRMQLLSIISALGILTLVYLLLKRLIETGFWFVVPGKKDQTNPLSSRVIQAISLASALILAFSYQFWSQTLNSESYILTNFLMVSLLTLVLTVPMNGKVSNLRLILGATVLGIASGTNPTIVQSLPALVLGAIFFWKKLGLKRVMVVVLIATVLTIAFYAYLPLRASQYPFLNWGNPQTPELFWGHLKGEGLDINDPRTNSINGFTGSPQIFARSIGRYLYLLCLQFTPILLPLIGLGIFYGFKKNWRLALVLISVPIVNLIFGGLYLSGNQESWFIASYIIFVLFMGFGLSLVIKALLGLNLKSIFLILFILVLIPLMWWFPKLDRSSHITTTEYADNLYSNLPKGAVLIGSGDFFNSLSHYEYEVIKDRSDVFPVVANMWYILPWYRETLRHHRPDLVPQELEGMIKKDRLEEYNEVMNWYIRWLIDHGHPVYVTPMVFRETVLAGTDAGKYKPDAKKVKAVISGLAYRMLTAEDLLTPSEESFNYKFKDPNFYKPVCKLSFQTMFSSCAYKNPPFYLERNYKAAYHLLLQEYGISYVTMADYFWNNKDSKKAAEYLGKAYDIAPFSVEIVNRMAIFAAMQGNIKQSIKFFKEASALDPAALEVKLNLAKALLSNKRGDEAKKELDYIVANAQNPQLKEEAQAELSKITSAQLAGSIPADWKDFASNTQGFSFKYPSDWKVSSSGGITTITAEDGFSISFYGGKLTSGQTKESWASQTPIQFPGKLENKGAAQIPPFDAIAAYWINGGVKTLEFILNKDRGVLHLKVDPVGAKSMQNLDTILSSIQFN